MSDWLKSISEQVFPKKLNNDQNMMMKESELQLALVTRQREILEELNAIENNINERMYLPGKKRVEEGWHHVVPDDPDYEIPTNGQIYSYPDVYASANPQQQEIEFWQQKAQGDRGFQNRAAESPLVEYEYNDEARQKYGMPSGKRVGTLANKIPEELTTRSKDGLQVLLPDRVAGTAIGLSAKNLKENKVQDEQMSDLARRLEALENGGKTASKA